MTPSNTPATTIQPVFHSPRTGWRWRLALGIVAMVMGLIGLGMIPFLTIIGVLTLGVVLVGAALFQLAQFFRAKTPQQNLARLAYPVAYAFGGIAMILNPPSAAVGLTLAIAIGLIFLGFHRLFKGLGHRDVVGWQDHPLPGFITVLGGSLLLVTWPFSSVWAIGIVVSVILLTSGWRNLIGSLVIRRSEQTPPQDGLPPASFVA